MHNAFIFFFAIRTYKSHLNDLVNGFYMFNACTLGRYTHVRNRQKKKLYDFTQKNKGFLNRRNITLNVFKLKKFTNHY